MRYVVLVATRSFNPPTYMHLRMFELARDAMLSEGYCVIGGYMSPVNDVYNKRGLVSAKHQLQMSDLASWTSDFIMVDPWECSWAGNCNIISQGTRGTPILRHCLCPHRYLRLPNMFCSGCSTESAHSDWLNYHNSVPKVIWL